MTHVLHVSIGMFVIEMKNMRGTRIDGNDVEEIRKVRVDTCWADDCAKLKKEARMALMARS